ncbi:hypothetical protein U6A24_10050 [Aquimarina gracilis]|uniref:Uncharacterized protein n=1 Tax=Aquimarina gracilis TaxID=874422 RepID=A0ABU5ZV69_9FLAO|nr:hypothetical protein [Aquimarina gracilis]MEB3345805.1 hypothetical protein [Aquimarina gracilis]
MTDTFTFLNDELIWKVGSIGLLLWGVFIWKESSEYGSYRFWIKVIVSLLAIVSLMAIVLQPAISSSRKSTKAILLTNGYNKSQLDSLKKVHKKIKVLTYEVNNLSFENEVDSIFLLGYGVEPFDFEHFKNQSGYYIPENLPSGIVQFDYNHQNFVGKSIMFHGVYSNPKKGNRLLLEDPGGVTVDSLVLTSEVRREFLLKAKLNIKGNHTFYIIEKDSLGEVLSKDPVPVVVEEAKFLKILMLNNFPTFETKYLKNYLTSLGHEIIVKSKLTKGRYKFEYFNTEKSRIGALTEKKLKDFDLVVIDAFSLRNLGRKSFLALENSVKVNGLGVLIQPDNNFFSTSNNIGDFVFVRDKNNEVTLKDLPKKKVTKNTFLFKNEFEILPIHKNIDKEIISAYRRVGNGRVGATILENTYELLLQGDSVMYKQLWSGVIEKLGNREIKTSQWQSNGAVVQVDRPFDFSLRTSIEKPIVKTSNEYSISLRQDINLKNVWYGTTYPIEQGWHKLWVEQDSTATFNYLVTDSLYWKSQKHYKNIEENIRYFNTSSIKAQVNQPLQPINTLWFYLLFLMCSGFLWLEPKMIKD